MFRISNDVKVRIGIEQGSVYNFSPEKGVSNHYFIVVNKNPKKDEEIYMVSFTSKRDHVLRCIEQFKLDYKTLVEIEGNECYFLDKQKQSCINCNYVKKLDIQKLIELIDSSNGSCNYDKISKKLMNLVIEGIKLSRLVSDDIKLSL